MSRRKRLAAVLVLALVVSLSLTLFASASSDSVGGGFSLWNLLDGLGGFFRDLINSIGGFFKGLLTAIGNAISFLLSGLKFLLIPSKESFSNFRDEILTTFDKKFGSVFSALNYLDARFQNLEAYSGLRNIFKITFPKGSFLYGVSINLIGDSIDFLIFIRVCLTGLCCLVTALICYHKVIAMTSK